MVVYSIRWIVPRIQRAMNDATSWRLGRPRLGQAGGPCSAMLDPRSEPSRCRSSSSGRFKYSLDVPPPYLPPGFRLDRIEYVVRAPRRKATKWNFAGCPNYNLLVSRLRPLACSLGPALLIRSYSMELVSTTTSFTFNSPPTPFAEQPIQFPPSLSSLGKWRLVADAMNGLDNAFYGRPASCLGGSWRPQSDHEARVDRGDNRQRRERGDPPVVSQEE